MKQGIEKVLEDQKSRNEYKRQWYEKNKERLRKEKAAQSRRWRKNNPEGAKERDRKKHEHNKVKRNQYSREYYELHKEDKEFLAKRNARTLDYYYKNKDKASARGLVGKAILRGKLSKPNDCQQCGNNSLHIEGHHHDYSKPLEVVWLCKSCHVRVHHG